MNYYLEKEEKEKIEKEAHILFVVLWDKSVDSDKYNKEEWNKFRDLISRLGVNL